jgi:hypothetical protein
MECLGLHNKHKAEVHKLTGPKEEEEEEEWFKDVAGSCEQNRNECYV